MNVQSIVGTSVLIALFANFGRAQIVSPPEVTLPAPGKSLTRIHVDFRWPAFAGAVSDYELQIVEDGGSFNPFVGGFPVRFHLAPLAEPRVVVTAGLEFGKPYAWRVIAYVGSPPVRTVSITRRFSIEPLPAEVPSLALTIPAGAGPVERGLVMFANRQGPSSGLSGSILYTVDETARIVHFMRGPTVPRVGDVRMLPDGPRRGRLLFISDSAILLGGGGRGFEGSIDGTHVWRSPDVLIGTYDPLSLHHEVFPMPNGDVLALVQDDRTLLINGQPRDFAGDAAVIFDRHTHDVVWSWSTFDDYSPRDVQPAIGPDDWTHGNGVVYDPARDWVIVSMRSLSRISAIRRSTGQLVWNMGEEGFQSGDVTFGDNLYSFQHAPEVLANGNLLIYDNGNNIEPLTAPRQSRAIEVAFDEPLNPTDAMIVWQYAPVDDQGQPVFTPFVGDADRLPGGHTLVTLGSITTIDEVDATASLLWRLKVGTGWTDNLVYRAEKIDALVHDAAGDSDGDWDLDMHDFRVLQLAFTGSGAPGLGFPDTLVDHDADGDVDATDAELFGRWATGPAR